MTYMGQPQFGGVMDPGAMAQGGFDPALVNMAQGGMNLLGQGGSAMMNLGGQAMGAIPGLASGAMSSLGGAASALGGGFGGAMGALGGGLGGAASALGSGAMGALGSLGSGAMGAMSALGPMGMIGGGLLGGMLKQKTWNPTDVISGGLTNLGDKLGQSKSPFAQALGKGIGGLGKLQSSVMGSKGAAGKLWDNTLGKKGIGGMVGKLFSDEQLKENIQYVGKSPSGVNVYEFAYKDKSYGSGRYRGVMAQEVPWAAERARNGYLMVDYSKVDVNFTTANK